MSPVTPDAHRLEDWEKAKAYFDEIKRTYNDIGACGQPALQIVFFPLERRYEQGERTQDLLDAMLSVR